MVDRGNIFKSKNVEQYHIDGKEFIADKIIKSNKYPEETLEVKTVTETLKSKSFLVNLLSKDKIVTYEVTIYKPKK